MKASLIKLFPENIEQRKVQKIVDVLKDGGIIIYPTDTVYGLGCDIFQPKAVEHIAQIKRAKTNTFSFICYDLSHISDFAKQVDTPTFKLMKKALPGPYTFILNATNRVPKILHTKKKTVGIRVPDNPIPREIVRQLGNPIITTSIHDEDEVIEYSTDPELIYEKYQNQVDLVIDGGYGNNVASTVINCTQAEPEVVREGLGDLSIL